MDTSGKNEWRVQITLDEAAFLRDSLKLNITLIPRELAEVLFEALAHTLVGVTDPFNEINRLKRELTETKQMLSQLIQDIGRLGGNDGK